MLTKFVNKLLEKLPTKLPPRKGVDHIIELVLKVKSLDMCTSQDVVATLSGTMCTNL